MLKYIFHVIYASNKASEYLLCLDILLYAKGF